MSSLKHREADEGANTADVASASSLSIFYKTVSAQLFPLLALANCSLSGR
jgi:hypothetical protein